MSVIRTWWYLCGLFFVAFVGASFVTVVPRDISAWGIVRWVLLCLCICSGIIAGLLGYKRKKNPESFIFKSKIIAWFCIGIAVVLTMFLLMGLIG
jgi:hypothetical protein